MCLLRVLSKRVPLECAREYLDSGLSLDLILQLGVCIDEIDGLEIPNIWMILPWNTAPAESFESVRLGKYGLEVGIGDRFIRRQMKMGPGSAGVSADEHICMCQLSADK